MPRSPILRICIDRWLPDQEPVNRTILSKAALEVPKMWEPSRTLRARFIGGDPAIREKVVNVAQEWSVHANITFDFGEHEKPELRIAFQPGGSWSYIGKDALNIAQNSPTMNLGWLTPTTAEDEVRRVVLHEFGHALGMIHEHQSPAAKLKWNKSAVYQYYQGPPNYWSHEQVEHNLFQLYRDEPTLTQFTAFDKDSIMLYPIPKEHTLDGFSTELNQALSATDKIFIADWYPFE